MFGNPSASNSDYGYCTSLTTIDLSATQVTSLPNNLFNGCTSLSNVKLPSGLTTINESAFQGATSLTTIEIPSSVTTINGSAFANSGLTTIDLSQTAITQIDNAVFQNTASLTDVKLPTRITSIGTRAFFNSGITALDLSSTALTTINQGAFANTASLTSLMVPKTLVTLSSDNNSGNGDVNATFTNSGLTTIDLSQTQIATISTSTFNGATKLETVKLPSTVTRINDNAFKGTTALKNLTQEKPAPSEPAPSAPSRAATNQLASTLTYIGTSAFQGTGLESIDLSETKIIGYNTNSLGNSAFQDAASLSDVTLPTGLKGIPAASFANTTSLKSIKIPDTVNRINAGNSTFLGAFQGSGLTSIDLSQTKVTGVTTADQDGS